MALGLGARQVGGHDPLVGRADELDLFEQVLEELNRGPAHAVELVGEPGIGKTRLLSELAARAELRGHLVLSGSASELERELPFSIFVHALDEYVESLDPNLLSTLDDDVQAELAHVFPSLSALAAGRAVALQHERYRSHRAVRALLEHLAQNAAARPRARRLPLGRLGVGRAARRALAPAARDRRAHRTGAPPAPDAGATWSRARARASCGGADPGRDRRPHPGRGSSASR